jgi:hypothetical protein
VKNIVLFATLLCFSQASKSVEPCSSNCFPPELAPSKGGGIAPPNPGSSLKKSETPTAISPGKTLEEIRSQEVLEAHLLGSGKSILSSSSAAPTGFTWQQHIHSCLDYDWGEVSEADRERSTSLKEFGNSHCKSKGKIYGGIVRCNGASKKIEVLCK